MAGAPIVLAGGPSAPIVLAGGPGGITLMDRRVRRHRSLFPHLAVDALAFTSMGDFFAFACGQDVTLVETSGFTIIYSLEDSLGYDDIHSLVFVHEQMIDRDLGYDAASRRCSRS